jgi:hypothetical protein
MLRTLVLALILIAATGAHAADVLKPLRVRELPDRVPADRIELRGVGAGPFDPQIWKAGTLHWVADVRWPLIEPRAGKFRNVYAPAAVHTADGRWRVFFGGWDGADTGNDRVYSLETRDFLTFEKRHTVIEHAPFQHVCNVSAARRDDGAYGLVCTAFPDSRGRNKPIFVTSPDGKTWNGAPPPYVPNKDDFVSVDGYDKFPDADINGMNVLLRDGDAWRLYFADFRDFGKVMRATGADARRYRLDGVSLSERLAPNDVKKLRTADESWYLMGLHLNAGKLWYTLSPDGVRFPRSRELFESAGAPDAFIVSMGFVADDRRVLGVLYGAGADSSLAANRIFARWLQKRVAVNGAELEAALGPDRAVITNARPTSARVEVFHDDGRTPFATAEHVELRPGRAYQISFD